MTCRTRKHCYNGYVAAVRAATAIARILKNHDENTVGVYRCSQCGCWHVGTEIQNKNIYKRERRPIKVEEEE